MSWDVCLNTSIRYEKTKNIVLIKVIQSPTRTILFIYHFFPVFLVFIKECCIVRSVQILVVEWSLVFMSWRRISYHKTSWFFLYGYLFNTVGLSKVLVLKSKFDGVLLTLHMVFLTWTLARFKKTRTLVSFFVCFVCIAGCGSIGTYLGATLILGGFSDTVLVGRPRLLAEIEQQGGLRISDFEKNQLFLPRERIQFRTLIGDLSDRFTYHWSSTHFYIFTILSECCLNGLLRIRSALIFTCKLVSLEAIAKEIRVTGQLSPSASLFVLTNGLAGEEILRRVFPEHFVYHVIQHIVTMHICSN